MSYIYRDAELIQRIGAVTALEMRASGLHYAFAPCVAVSATRMTELKSLHQLFPHYYFQPVEKLSGMVFVGCKRYKMDTVLRELQ